MEDVAANLERVLAEIATAAQKCGRSIRHTNRRALSICLVVWLTVVFARASMWVDPDWEQMLRDSDLITLVEVIQPGKFIAQVKPLAVFKGTAKDAFYVTGYNNGSWPADAITKEAFQRKQRYYLFLREHENPAELDFLAEEAKATADPELKALVEKARTGPVRSVWSPSAGDLLVERRKVHFSLLKTSYPLSAPLHSQTEFEEFLRGAIAFHMEGKADSKILDRAMQEIRSESARPGDSVGEENRLAYVVARYSLLGGRSYDPVFETIATSKNDSARLMLARLLGAIHDERASKLLLTMLADKNSVVQGEVVRQLTKGNPKQIGAVLLAHLADAGAHGIYPGGLMDPVRNQLDGGKIEIVRAIGELKYQPAVPALIHLVESADNGYSLTVVLETLEKLGNRDYAHALEGALRNPKLVRTIATWVRDHKVTEMKSALERWLEKPPAEAAGGPLWEVIEALGKIGDKTTAVQLTAHLHGLTSREVPEFFDDGNARALIGALATLRYKPARAEVERAFFYWLGVDSTFTEKPELLKLKERLERDLEREATLQFRDFKEVEAQSLVFLNNRRALADGSAAVPEYNFAVHVDIRSPEHPELDPKALNSRLAHVFRNRPGRTSVTRWNANMGRGSEGGDLRVGGHLSSLFFSSYGQYVQGTRDPKDLGFVKFLLESGLAETWQAKDELLAAFESIPSP